MGTGQGTAGTEPGGYFDTYFPPATPANASTYAGVEGEILKDKEEKREDKEKEGEGEKRRGRSADVDGSSADLRGWEGRSGGENREGGRRDENEDAVDDEEELDGSKVRRGSGLNPLELFRNSTERDDKTKNENGVVEGGSDGVHAMSTRTLSMNSYLDRPTKPVAVARSDSDPAATSKEEEESGETASAKETSAARTDGDAEQRQNPLSAWKV